MLRAAPRIPALAPVAALVAGLGGVALGGACSANFQPASLVVNARVIALTAEPPESTPGGQVTLTPTVVSPTGELVEGTGYTASWWRCPDSDSDALGDFDQCTVPATRATIASGTPYVDSVPTTIFGPLPTGGGAPSLASLGNDKLLGAILGYWRVVGFTMDDAAEKRTVDAFKREPIYIPGKLSDIDPSLAGLDSHVDDKGNALGPNTNPTISGVLIHQDKVDGPTTTTLQKTKTYFFAPLFDERALQPYISLKVNLDGLDLSDPASLKSIPASDLLARFQKEQRCEIPVFSWFITAGTLRRDSTLDEGVIARVFDPQGVDCPAVEGTPRSPEVEYTPPQGTADDPKPKDGVVHAWVVMRDGRGGTAVRSFDFTVQ